VYIWTVVRAAANTTTLELSWGSTVLAVQSVPSCHQEPLGSVNDRGFTELAGSLRFPEFGLWNQFDRSQTSSRGDSNDLSAGQGVGSQVLDLTKMPRGI